MTKSKQHFLSLCSVIIFFVLAVASSGTKKMTFTEKGGQIPPEFSTFKDTLLVISHGDDWGYNKYLKKNFSENYNGPYKIIKENELASFSTEKYRYVFDHSLNYSTKTNTTTGRSSTYASSDVFFITDRQTKTDYVTKSSAYYSKLMRAYIKALEEIRPK